MRAFSYLSICIAVTSLFLFSCKKTEVFQTDQPSDYLPLQSGKYITYRLDSTVFTNFGRTTEIHSYEEKQVIDSQIQDNLGRTSYRVYRYLRDTLETQDWAPSGSLFITPASATMEVIENNLRVVKLTLPIKQDDTWKGNHYLPDQPYSSFYTFSNDDNMQDWDFTYTILGQDTLVNGSTYKNVLTVDGVNESINVPVTDPNAYAAINYYREKYAKGLGMISQQFIMWEYQPNTGGSGGGFKNGFGVSRTILNHN